MKPVLLLLASLVLSVLVFLGGVVITANVIAKPEEHRFANMDTPDLWTSQPKPIDPSRQQYERIPPATPPASAVANAPKKPDAPVPGPAPATSAAAVPNAGVANAAIDNTVTGSVNPAPQASMDARAPDIGNPSQPAAAIGPAQAAWCYARYRSYRVEDNSYQPYNGPRRQCRPPPGAIAETAVETRREPDRQTESEPVPSEAVGAHEEWCFARYRSYRVEDNSYQPFDGSSRRQCQSPYG